MGRFEQGQGSRGSLRWIQRAVSAVPEVLAEPLGTRLELGGSEAIEWLSPLEEDGYAEYRDQAFVERLGASLSSRELKTFWPSQGPQWDALGRTSRGDLLLVEAKAHIGELVSSSGAVSPTSVELIRSSLDEVREYLGGTNRHDWSTVFYQHANRLAHLYFLRVLHQLPAWLDFVYFLNDVETGGPATEEEWRGAICLMQAVLGIDEHSLSPYVIDLFVDIDQLRG